MTAYLKYVLVLIAVILIGLAANAWWQRHKGNADAVTGERIKVVAHEDSAHTVYRDSLSHKIDTVTRDVVRVVDRWKVVTDKVVIPGRIDSVFKDSAFAALTDSQKVELLRIVGNAASAKCLEMRSLCMQYRDSAVVGFRTKDSLIQLWRIRYDQKPRRSCGPGMALGVGGGYSAGGIRPMAGAVVGWACNF